MKIIIITGFVGRNPEVRHSPEGAIFVTFSVGVNVGNKTNPKTDWVEVNCNGKLGEIAQSYVKQGSKVLIEGFPSVRAYIGKDGKAVASLKITAKILEILSSKDDDTQKSLVNNDGGVPFTNQF